MKISLSKLITDINKSADLFVKSAANPISNNQFDVMIDKSNENLKLSLSLVKLIYEEFIKTGNGRNILIWELNNIKEYYIPELGGKDDEDEIDEDDVDLTEDKAILNNFLNNILNNVISSKLKGDPNHLSDDVSAKADEMKAAISKMNAANIAAGIGVETKDPLLKGVNIDSEEGLAGEFNDQRFDLRDLADRGHTVGVADNTEDYLVAAAKLEILKKESETEQNPEIKKFLEYSIYLLDSEVKTLMKMETLQTESKDLNPEQRLPYEEQYVGLAANIKELREKRHNNTRNINTINLKARTEKLAELGQTTTDKYDRLRISIEYNRNKLRLSNDINKRKALQIYDRLLNAFDDIMYNQNYTEEKKYELIAAEMGRIQEAEEVIEKKYFGQVTTVAAAFKSSAYGIADRLADTASEFLRNSAGDMLTKLSDESLGNFEQLFFNSTMYKSIVDDIRKKWMIRIIETQKVIAILTHQAEIKKPQAGTEREYLFRSELPLEGGIPTPLPKQLPENYLDIYKTLSHLFDDQTVLNKFLTALSTKNVAGLRAAVSEAKDSYKRRIVAPRLSQAAYEIIDKINNNANFSPNMSDSDTDLILLITKNKRAFEALKDLVPFIGPAGVAWRDLIKNGGIGAFILTDEKGGKPKHIKNNIADQTSQKNKALILLDNLINKLNEPEIREAFPAGTSEAKTHYISITKNANKLKAMVYTLMEERNISSDIITSDEGPEESPEQAAEEKAAQRARDKFNNASKLEKAQTWEEVLGATSNKELFSGMTDKEIAQEQARQNELLKGLSGKKQRTKALVDAGQAQQAAKVQPKPKTKHEEMGVKVRPKKASMIARMQFLKRIMANV